MAEVKAVEISYRELTYFEFVSGSFTKGSFAIFMAITLVFAVWRNDFIRLPISVIVWIIMESILYWIMKPKPIVEVYRI